MTHRTRKSWLKIFGAYALLALLLAAGVMSCNSFLSPPRQGWNRSYGPVVPHDKFPGDCSICHVGKGWTTIKSDFTFDHEKQTGVPLRGAHQRVTCLLCHNDRGPVRQFAAKGCAGCHVDIHRSQLGKMCSDCHDERSWRPIEIIARHNRTRFQLVGAHASASCFQCHPGAQVGNFNGADPTCVRCHQADLAQATSPDHQVQGWTSDCQRCHLPTGWKPALFKHPPAFPLTGGHAGVQCTTCHAGGVYTKLPTDCVSCHLTDFQKTTDPNHLASGFSTNCASCHRTTSWSGASFNHPASFPLTGGHAKSCSSCHAGGVYTGLSKDCVSCHLKNYTATTDPNHAASGFGTDCATCHSTTKWSGAKFTHSAAFPLTGGHARSCSSCHAGGVFTGLSKDCVSCHLKNYTATTDPNHAASGFGTDCATCHSTTKWSGAKFNHPASFPLTSAHAGRSCSACHKGGVYTGLTKDCVSCHLPAFQATKNPNHATSGFGTGCASCHAATKWTDGKFTHPSSFPLTNGHAGRACSACHGGGVYKGLPKDCVSCHLTAYQATKNPNHATSGFGTGCASCHPITRWTDGKFTHRFPITSGPHKLACNQCHLNAANMAVFSCIDCHTHAKSAMDSKHREVRSYIWATASCYSCHPRGQGD